MARSTGDRRRNSRSRCGVISFSSSGALLGTPRSSSLRKSLFWYSSSERASSAGSPPESCQAYSACSAISRAAVLRLTDLPLEARHFHRHAHRFGALVEPRLRLLLVVGGEDAVRDRHAAFEHHVHQAARRLVGHDLEVIG